MARALPRTERIPRLSRLSWLMGLYAENYRHLVRLFEPAGPAAGTSNSSKGGAPRVRPAAAQGPPHTAGPRPTYDRAGPLPPQPRPSAS